MAKTKNKTAQSQLFRKAPLPKMPEGYYSGDKPNPNLRKFIEEHLKEHPYDPAMDDYDVPPFDKPIETTKVSAIYNMHTYWSKKPHDAIRQYIRHYTKPGDLVLDPFCGSGSTALAALMEGRKAIAIDRSPAATFITKNYCTPVHVEELQKAFEQLKAKVKPEIDWLYQTLCDRCGGKARIYAAIFSTLYRCSRCLELIPLLDTVEEKRGYNKVIHYCPHCKARGIDEEISLRSQKQGCVLRRVTYTCSNTACSGEYRDREIPYPRDDKAFPDVAHLNDVMARPIDGYAPPTPMMHVSEGTWGLLYRPYHGAIRTVSDFYSPRNLRALTHIFSTVRREFEGDLRDILLFAIEAISMNMSRLQGYSEDPRFPNSMMKGTLYTPPIWREYNVLDWLAGKMRNLVAGYKAIGLEGFKSTELCISTHSVCNMPQIRDKSVDYVFTDPPYSNKIQFGELNFMWEEWMGFASDWQGDEIIVNEHRNKTETDWAAMMRSAMGECYRVLKPGRWLSLCYHDSSEGSWETVQDIMAECGFVCVASSEATYIDTDRKSWKQIVADKVTKRDLVINFRKPRLGEDRALVAFTGKEDEQTFSDKARAVIVDFLQTNPGSTKDRIYDALVSRMVRKGLMEAHNFDELLQQVADEVKQPVKKNLWENEDPNLFGTHEIGRWYLKETADEADAAETAKENLAAESLLRFIKKAKKDYDEGVHYSDLFEHFIYAVKDKPRRQLADWLPDYFFKTEAGTWRLPASKEEEQIKAKGRQTGLTRKIKRYVSCIEARLPISSLPSTPSNSDLAEWIRHCKRAGLYEQGKLLYEKGGLTLDQLSDEAQANVEEDYQVCVRILSRETAAKPAKGKRGRKSGQAGLDF